MRLVSLALQLVIMALFSVELLKAECQPIYVFTGDEVESVGFSVATAGDINKDGYADIIVSAPTSMRGGLEGGRVYIFSGLDGDTLYVFNGEAISDWFGLSAASAGDVNNDGYDDLIVGAIRNDAGGTNAGRAYVFSGLNGDTLHIFTGEEGAVGFSSGDELGISVASAGDVNNDGYSDLIIGAWLNDGNGDRAGRAYVFSGLDGDTLYVFNGEAAGDRFGHSVASAGDVNNDGVTDLIVSAFGNDVGGSNAGRVYVFSGANGDTLHVFTGEVTEGAFGIDVASAGDVNNDGYSDLIVGSGGSSEGQAFVFSGLNGETLVILNGESRIDRFGSSVASAGDINNDGHTDLIVGAKWYGEETGRAYVFSGLDYKILSVFNGEFGANVFSTGDEFGKAVSSAGDINKDGYIDLIIGAPGNKAGGLHAGRAYVFSGAPGNCCCAGNTGNIDCDPGSVVDISDLTVLINHLFIDLHPLCCREQGNVDGDLGAVVDITDLTFLIDHLFISLVPTSLCQ